MLAASALLAESCQQNIEALCRLFTNGMCWTQEAEFEQGTTVLVCETTGRKVAEWMI